MLDTGAVIPLSTNYPRPWGWIFMPDPLHYSLQLCEADIAMPILEMRKQRLKIMEKIFKMAQSGYLGGQPDSEVYVSSVSPSPGSPCPYESMF